MQVPPLQKAHLLRLEADESPSGSIPGLVPWTNRVWIHLSSVLNIHVPILGCDSHNEGKKPSVYGVTSTAPGAT